MADVKPPPPIWARLLMILAAIVLIGGGLMAWAKYDEDRAAAEGRAQAEKLAAPVVARIGELNHRIALLEGGTAQQFVAADASDQSYVVGVWVRAINPNAVQEEIDEVSVCTEFAAARARDQGQPMAPIRPIAATCIAEHEPR